MTPDQQFAIALVTIAAGVITTAIAAIYGVKQSVNNATKLSQIHVLVNSNLTDLKDQLADSLARLAAMQQVVNSRKPLVSGDPLVSAQAVQAVLDVPSHAPADEQLPPRTPQP